MAEAPPPQEAAPKKRLAIFLDGTWNTVGDNTNVWRLKSLCSTATENGVQQLVYYDAGLGTQFGEKVRGGMFGFGIGKNLKDAYEWLIDKHNEGDEIFIFGFSRGAYTARSLAGFIALCGLLQPGAPLSINQLYARYRREDEPRTVWKLKSDEAEGKLGECTLEDEWVLKYSRAVRIKFVGVWDTVGSLGIPALNIQNIGRKSFKFMHTGLRTPILHGFHAVAIDEHRKAFAPTLWTKKTRKGPNAVNAPDRTLDSVEQRWFVGAHANVGGGCENDLLAQVPLQWLMRKAVLHGLRFRSDVVLDGDVFASQISDSYKEFAYGLYRLVKFGLRHHRAIGQEPIETPEYTEKTVNETIDVTVFGRWKIDDAYRPESLAAWVAAKKVDISTLESSVRADNPTINVAD